MTRKIEKSAKSAALATTEIIIFPSQDGPESIESAFDEAIASAALLDIVLAGESVINRLIRDSGFFQY